MKKIMGIDISSSSTGWSIIQGNQLLEYGKINPTGKTISHAQKMFLFHIELRKIIERYQPDEIAIEDVPLVKSASVAKLLAKFNGIAMIEAYRHLQKDPMLYMPTEWKIHVEGCTGGSKKCEVQIAICQIFGLLSENKIQTYREKITEAKSEAKEGLCEKRNEIKEIKKLLNKAKKNSDIKMVLELENKIKELTPKSKNEVQEIKKQLKKAKKNDDKELVAKLEQEIKENNLKSKTTKNAKKELTNIFDQMSIEIYTETGINEDIADSIGVAIAFQKNKL